MNDNENNIFEQGNNTPENGAVNNPENPSESQQQVSSTDSTYSPQQADINNESVYGTPVNNIEPNVTNNAQQPPVEHVEAEPQYSPYSGAYNSQPFAQYNDAYTQQPPVQAAPVKKKTSKGFKAFIISLVAVIVCVAIIIGVYSILGFKKTDKTVTNGDSTQIQISESPSTAAKGDALTTENIADNAKKFNVGILLYGGVKSFSASASGTSLVGEGSGVIMSEDSSGKYTYILTCAHVISEVATSGYSMTVQDYDGNTYEGILVGYDTKTDVGVIKVEKTGLTCAEFGDSSSLAIGQTVYAIGNPGGTEFFGSFTDGIVSSIDRPISSESGYEMKCIQHTAAINSGNSGGALLNAYGQVVGINSSKIVSTGYEGMAFAIPISDAKSIINDIISNGYVTNRPKLGITYAAVSNYQQYNMIVQLKELPSASLIIASISTDSSLAKTDAKVGDMIIKVNGEDMDSASVLLDKIENGKVGDTLKLTLCRVNDDYSINTFDVTAKLVEDKGTATSDEQQTTTQSYWEQYFGSNY